MFRNCTGALVACDMVAVHAFTLEIWSRVRHEQVLDAAERHRCEAKERAIDRDLFIASRALAKAVVAERIGRHPSQVTLTSVAGQRPQVVGFSQHRISIAHTRGLVAVACCSHTDIGVDAEFLDRDLDTGALARRFFCASEHVALAKLDAAAQDEGFFRLWTGKEALLKGSGTNLDAALATDLHGLLETPHRAHDGPWSVQSLPAVGSCALAVAAPGSAWQHCLKHWDSADLAACWSA